MRRFYVLLLLVIATFTARAQITFDSSGFPQIALETTTPPGELMQPRVSNDLVMWESLSPVVVGADGKVRFTDYGGVTQRRRLYQAGPVPGPGSYMFYERRAPDGSHSVFRCRLDGTQELCLGAGHYPRPSPNGRWVLVTRGGGGPSFHTGASIWTLDLQNPGGQACGFAARLIFNNVTGEDLINFTWETNNIFFVFDCGGRLYRMTADGGGRTPVFPTSDCIEAMPSFRPDNGALVFAHRLPSQLTTRRLGDIKQPLTAAGRGDSWPQWSYDGALVAACDGNTDLTRTDLGHDLFTADPNTSARTPLTQLTEPGDGFPQGAVWSRNNLFLYGAGTVNGVRGVWRLPATGGTPQAVNITSVFDPAPGVSSAPVAFIGGIIE